MKLSQLTLAMAIAAVPMTGTFAAALDRSGQSMNAFFQEGNYFEAGLSVLDPSVSGKEAGTTSTTRDISDMGESYMFPTAALKLQPHEKVSIGLLYDQPYGAEAEYSGTNAFVANSATDTQNTLGGLVTRIVTPAVLTQVATNMGITNPTAEQLQAIAQNPDVQQQIQRTTNTQVNALTSAFGNFLGSDDEGTNVTVHTQSLSLVAGFQPNKNWNIYAGPVYQTVKGDVHLRGTAYSLYNGYDFNAPETGGWGWLAGVAYSKPEIALRAAITYRSEIDHDISGTENLPALDVLSAPAPQLSGILNRIGSSTANMQAIATSEGKTKITLPQSLNIDLQSGIAPNTLAFVNLRWVDWSEFAIQPYKFGLLSQEIGGIVGQPNGFNLVQYSKDQYSATVGVGRKFNDKWTGSVAAGWDSGAGNPVSTLGPTEGYWNLGLGVQYSPQKNYFIAGGVKHFWLGDAKAQTGAQAGTENYVSEFKDNNAWAYGLKIGYKF